MFSGIKKSHSSKKIVAYVGMLSKQKGFDEMLEIAKLCQDDDNIQFIFAGKYAEPYIKKELTKLEKNTTYLGEVNQGEIVKLLMNSDIGLCLLHETKSYKESMPLKIFEYINSETFVIASNFRNWEFLEKRSVGKIFQYNDLEAISLFIKGFSSFNNSTTRYYFDDYINLFLEKEFYENSNYF
jgi:glycosyltransferase involved in cell wall biosynthesis